MGYAMLMYAQDNDETMPLWIPAQGGPAGGDSVLRNNYGFTIIQPYIKNVGVYDDPDCIQWDEVGGTTYVPNPSLPNDFPVDYRFNLNGTDGFRMANNSLRSGSTVIGTFSMTLADCPLPAEFFMVSDRHTQHHTDGGANIVDQRARYLMPMVFADGHAKPIRIYSAQDSKGQLKPYHWNFPNCHLNDVQVRGEYGF